VSAYSNRNITFTTMAERRFEFAATGVLIHHSPQFCESTSQRPHGFGDSLRALPRNHALGRTPSEVRTDLAGECQALINELGQRRCRPLKETRQVAASRFKLAAWDRLIRVGDHVGVFFGETGFNQRRPMGPRG